MNPEHGDQWVFLTLDAQTKLVPCWLVGKRDGNNAWRIVNELAQRIDGPFQLTTDDFSGYKSAWGVIRRRGIDYATQTKSYTATNPSFGRYSPPRVSRCTTDVVAGNPDPEAISTSYVERNNLTMRMHMRRFTRLTNGFSKDLRHLRAAVSLHFAWYDFVRVHESLRTTPAVVAEVADTEWRLDDLLAWEAPY